MKPLYFIAKCVFIVVIYFACNPSKEQPEEIKFNKNLWAANTGKDYPNRNAMLKDLMSDPVFRAKKRDTLLNLLGPATRTDSNYLFYTISQKRLGIFPLHTRSLVIKFNKDSFVEWMKIHE